MSSHRRLWPGSPLDPDHVDAYIDRGLSYAKLSDYRQAFADLAEAIDLAPQYADAYVGRGRYLLRSGRLRPGRRRL